MFHCVCCSAGLFFLIITVYSIVDHSLTGPNGEFITETGIGGKGSVI